MNEENIAVNKLVIEGTLLARDEGAHPDSLHICNLNKLGYFPEHQGLVFTIRSHFPAHNTPYGYSVYGKVRITIESLDMGLYAAKRSEEGADENVKTECGAREGITGIGACGKIDKL